MEQGTAVKLFLSALGWFRGRAPDGADRRVAPRYPVVENRGQLAWNDKGQDRYCFVRVLNISQGGAEVVAEQVPVLGGPVWLRLASPSETGWVEGRVVRVKRGKVIGLKFDAACSYDLFKTATHGRTLDTPGILYNAPEFDGRYWR